MLPEKSSRYLIYGLFDPRTGELRYVGKTEGRLGKRLNEHVCRAWQQKNDGSFKYRHHVYCWIRSLGRDARVEIDELDCAVNREDLIKSEQWNIEYWRSIGADLTNRTEGGEGCFGYKHTPEARARISAAKKGKPASPAAVRAKRKLTDAQEAEAIERYLNGEALDVVGQAYDVSGGCIRKVMVRAGIPRRSASAGRWLTEKGKVA